MPLNEDTNASYLYLRDKGNNWTYKVEDVHPKLIARLYKRFDTFDLDSDGVMTMEELMKWPKRIQEIVPDCTDEEVTKCRTALKAFFGACGVGYGDEGLKRADWVEGNQVVAEAERERKKRSEPSLVAALGNAYFDILDNNNDGTVGIDELKIMMKVFQVPEVAAYFFFDKADISKDGKLQRKEMHNVFTKFWLSKYDAHWDNVYAFKY